MIQKIRVRTQRLLRLWITFSTMNNLRGSNRLMWLTLLTWFAMPATAQPARSLTVYAFLSTECPISQQYVRRLAELHQRYGPSGVRFVALFTLRTDTPLRIRAFRSQYGLPFAGQPDPHVRLARQFRVRVTPEVVVMQSDGRIRYQGAIDDWYSALGKHRTEATQHYLRDALDALLAGKEVLAPKTDAVGCLVE